MFDNTVNPHLGKFFLNKARLAFDWIKKNYS